MARIAIITHEFDRFAKYDADEPGKVVGQYLLFDVLRQLRGTGHKAVIVSGAKTVEADLALLHVDATIMTPEYLALANHYPRVLNVGVNDISKRAISKLLVTQADSWDGPVIVKSNFNRRAIPECTHNMRAKEMGRPEPHRGVRLTREYRVYDSKEDVGEDVWSNPALVVERFVPERERDGNYVFRTWVFMGPNERCTRFVTPDQISRADSVVSHEPAEVPEELRAERKRLGFDYGKFDFVMHDGKPVLLDANKTPGVSRTITAFMQDGARNLAQGLDKLMRGEA